MLLNTCKHMAQEHPGRVYPVTGIRQTLGSCVRATSSAPVREGTRQRTKRLGFCLDCQLSVCTTNPVPEYQNPCKWDGLYWGTFQWHDSTSLLISHPKVEGLNKAETGAWLASGLRIQRWGEMLDGDADLNRGDLYGQGKEQIFICSPFYLFILSF